MTSSCRSGAHAVADVRQLEAAARLAAAPRRVGGAGTTAESPVPSRAV
jgi:hypothetical protein